MLRDIRINNNISLLEFLANKFKLLRNNNISQDIRFSKDFPRSVIMLLKLIVYPLCVFLILLAICVALLLIAKIRISFRKKARLQRNEPRKISVGFFHPIQYFYIFYWSLSVYRDISGEKERLVWSMINTLLTQNAQNFPHIEVVIYLSAYSNLPDKISMIYLNSWESNTTYNYSKSYGKLNSAFFWQILPIGKICNWYTFKS